MIECTRYQKYEGGKSQHLLGFADLYLRDINADIFGARLYQKNGQRWVKLPGRDYLKDGEDRFAPFIRFRDKERWESIIAGALAAIEEFCAQATASSVFEAETPF